jgi:tetratricopeptide (TPR) repeat protein
MNEWLEEPYPNAMDFRRGAPLPTPTCRLILFCPKKVRDVTALPTLADAFALHQQGKLAEAEAQYRAILAAAPDHASTHHLLGLVLHQLGRQDAALQSITRAIELNSTEPNYHNNLGAVFRALQRFGDAVASYRRALALKPDFAAALNNLGLVLQQQGQLDAAQIALEQALQITPDDAEALFNLGNVLTGRGETQKAVEQYLKAVAKAPHFAEAYNNLGVALAKLGRPDLAQECYRRVLMLQPGNATSHSNYGQLLARRDELAAAAQCLSTALTLDPHHIDAHVNLGNVLLEQGRPQAAHQSFERALALDPTHEAAHWNDGLALLIAGDLPNGFRQWRWQVPASRRFAVPEWRGEPLHGATVLVHAEQGFGDTIQFARYLPLVARRGGRIVLEAPSALHRLLVGIDGVERVLAIGDPLPDFGWHAPLLSLPIAFGTELATVPAAVPYLRVDPLAVEEWRRRLARPGLKVGLVWAGRPEHERDRHRSLALAQLAPLAAVGGVAFFALQKGVAVGEVAHAPHGLEIEVLDPLLGDFADTAAAIMALDLVISVDTSVAHLAGALGKPVWLLLPFVPDWRWLETRRDSPWYPTARLFRQTEWRRWESVVEAVTEALKAMAVGVAEAPAPRLSAAG